MDYDLKVAKSIPSSGMICFNIVEHGNNDPWHS